jgi:hypothetical protein
MNEVSLLRLYLMRAFYLLILLGVGSMALPALTRPTPLDPLDAVAFSFWGALALLAAIGLRYPLQMVPLIMVQLVYKTIWLLAVAVPLWRAGAPFDAATADFTWAMAIGVALDLIVIPWGYVLAHYVRKTGDKWAARREPRTGLA